MKQISVKKRKEGVTKSLLISVVVLTLTGFLNNLLSWWWSLISLPLTVGLYSFLMNGVGNRKNSNFTVQNLADTPLIPAVLK